MKIFVEYIISKNYILYHAGFLPKEARMGDKRWFKMSQALRTVLTQSSEPTDLWSWSIWAEVNNVVPSLPSSSSTIGIDHCGWYLNGNQVHWNSKKIGSCLTNFGIQTLSHFNSRSRNGNSSISENGNQTRHSSYEKKRIDLVKKEIRKIIYLLPKQHQILQEPFFLKENIRERELK